MHVQVYNDTKTLWWLIYSHPLPSPPKCSLSALLRLRVQVYDDTKKLKRTLDLIEPVIAASWLNIEGDIVAALERNLVVIRTDTYQFLTQDEMVALIAEHTKGVIPGPVHPTPLRSSALQRQATLQQQLSMIPAALCDDFLSHLMTLSADARLSIFDVPPSRPEVAETAVVARVATAAKAWQRYKSAANSPTPTVTLPADPNSIRENVGHGEDVATAQHSSADMQRGEARGAHGPDRVTSHAAASTSAAAGASGQAGKQRGGVGWAGVVGASAHGSRRSSAAQRSVAHVGLEPRYDPGNVNMHRGVTNRYMLYSCLAYLQCC